MTIRIASFDIGKKNFAFYVEDCRPDILLKLSSSYSSLPKKFQRRVKGLMNNKIDTMLSILYKSSKRVEMGVFDLRERKDSNILDMETRVNMCHLLESYNWLWLTCDIIIIEQQYFNIKGGEANVDAIKLGECCLCWFLINYGLFKEIQYFGSTYKTQTLGAPNKMTKSQRKKWSIEKGRSIFNLRNDEEGLNLLDSKKNSAGKKQKQDDICDCIIMTQAYKFRKLVSNI